MPSQAKPKQAGVPKDSQGCLTLDPNGVHHPGAVEGVALFVIVACNAMVLTGSCSSALHDGAARKARTARLWQRQPSIW